jgi:MraZ protein
LFVGEYHHALDDKGRVVLPAAYRASVAERGYIASLGECIGLWDEPGFERVTDGWREALRAGDLDLRTFRLLTTSVHEVKLDSAGRITVPRRLLDDLGFGREVRIVGVLDRVELWDDQRYQADHDMAANAAAVAERMNELRIV